MKPPTPQGTSPLSGAGSSHSTPDLDLSGLWEQPELPLEGRATIWTPEGPMTLIGSCEAVLAYLHGYADDVTIDDPKGGCDQR